MGLFTEVRRSITRLWGRTEQAVGEAYGNQALEYEGAADEAKADADEAADGHQHGHRTHGRNSGGSGSHSHSHSHSDSDSDSDSEAYPDDDGTTGTPAR